MLLKYSYSWGLKGKQGLAEELNLGLSWNKTIWLREWVEDLNLEPSDSESQATKFWQIRDCFALCYYL